MKPTARLRSALFLALVGLLLATLSPAGSASGESTTRQQSTAQQSNGQQSADRTTARKRAKLRVSPGRYVGGQKVTFAGNIGRQGRHRLHLQTHMARPGDKWTNLDARIRARTRPNGSFRFSHIAPSMFGIRVRVVSGRAHTPPVRFNARSQDLVLAAPGQVAGGDEFTIRVDTTPILSHRPDLPPPAFPGRTLTLQERDGGDAVARHSTRPAPTTTARARFELTADWRPRARLPRPGGGDHHRWQLDRLVPLVPALRRGGLGPMRRSGPSAAAH